MRQFRSPLQKVRRLMKVVEYLQSGRGFNARDLAEMCGVTRRQIFRDLKALQDSGVPVLFDATRQAYWLPQPTFLPALELTLSEALALVVLASNLGTESYGIPGQSAARDAALKLCNSLPSHLRQHVGELTELIEVRAEPHHPLNGGRDTLDLLHQALRDKRRLRLRYRSLFEQREIATLLSPYRLLYCRHSWYVIGRSSAHRSVRTFHVGRILECELTKDRYQTPPRFSLEKYLGNAWRLIRDRNQSVHVLIRFQPLVAQNVAEVVWHKTQELHWNDDGTLDFGAHVEGIQEISWWVLGYGDQAEVLAPKSLRDLVAERVRNMACTYGLLPRTRAKPRRAASSTAPVRRSAARRTRPR